MFLAIFSTIMYVGRVFGDITFYFMLFCEILGHFGPFLANSRYLEYWNDFAMHYFLFNDFYLSAWRHKHSFWCVFQQVEHPKWPILVFWGVLEGPKLPDQHFDQKSTWNMFIWSIQTLMQKNPGGGFFFFFWPLKLSFFQHGSLTVYHVQHFKTWS